MKETEEKVVQEEEPEEEEEKGISLQDYLANKKTTHFKKEARKPEELKKENIEKVARTGDRIETITSSLKNQELYSVAKS